MKASNKSNNKRSRKPEKAPEKSAEEIELEEFLFGKDIINNKAKKEEDEIEITIDTAPVANTDKVWHDDEDDELEVDLTQTSRLKKLRKSDSAPSTMKGDAFASALQERFQTRQLEWAKVEDKRTLALAEDRGLDADDLELLQQSESLVGRAKVVNVKQAGAAGKKGARNKNKSTAHYLDDAAAPYLPLPAGTINIKRMVNANIAEPSKQKITAVNFHPNGDLLLVAGEDKHMRFFRIDGDKNEKHLAVRVNDMIIQNATFRSSGSAGSASGGGAAAGVRGSAEEVVLCGRKPFFYSYDTASGNISKIPGPAGRGVKSLEHMAVSPEGSMLAFRGASGYVHVCSGSAKQWMMEVKMNTAVRSHCFLDEMTMATSGLDADVYIWDLRKTGRCVARFAHDDGTCTSHLSAYSPASTTSTTAAHYGSGTYKLPRSYLSVGCESGVVSIFGADRDAFSGAYDFTGGSLGGVPKQLKSVMTLTTQITSTCFHPSGQILAIASNQKQNQLKLIHLPSYTVFTNWPTQQTPFQRVECMAFSGAHGSAGSAGSAGGGGYFAVGNNTGKVLLYQLAHFGSA